MPTKRNDGVSDTLFFDEFAELPFTLPEHKLGIAIIQRAVWDYAGVAECKQEDRRSAELFLFPQPPISEHTEWSFPWWLVHLGADVSLMGKLQTNLRRMHADNRCGTEAYTPRR